METCHPPASPLVPKALLIVRSTLRMRVTMLEAILAVDMERVVLVVSEEEEERKSETLG